MDHLWKLKINDPFSFAKLLQQQEGPWYLKIIYFFSKFNLNEKIRWNKKDTTPYGMPQISREVAEEAVDRVSKLFVKVRHKWNRDEDFELLVSQEKKKENLNKIERRNSYVETLVEDRLIHLRGQDIQQETDLDKLYNYHSECVKNRQAGKD